MKVSAMIRSAHHGDATRVSETLGRAFDADPPLNWLIRKDERRQEAIREFWSVCFRRMSLPFGCVDVVEDGSAAALWIPPEKWNLGPLTQLSLLPAFMRALSAPRLIHGIGCINRIQAYHPSAPHYYLLGMGVEPTRQGQGIGSQLLRRRLESCDAQRLPAYLEASTRSSRALYERMGFVTQQEIRMAPDAPPMWAMWREPVGR